MLDFIPHMLQGSYNDKTPLESRVKSESVVIKADRNRGTKSIIPPSLPFSQVPTDSSPIRCEFVGNDALPPIRKSLEDNLLAMVRRLSQAEHKHSLSTGRTGVLGVWADTSQRLLRGSYNQSSAVAPLAIQAAPYMSPYRETAH